PADPARTAIYALSLHDALPILPPAKRAGGDPRPVPIAADLPRRVAKRPVPAKFQRRLDHRRQPVRGRPADPSVEPARGIARVRQDRKSTRLNSSHVKISYAVFC